MKYGVEAALQFEAEEEARARSNQQNAAAYLLPSYLTRPQ
jgi:hypothetical protein